MTNLLDDLLDRYKALPPDQQQEMREMAVAGTQDMVWVPQPGPQTDAYFSEADEVFYGGQAGGGKTDLGLGLALTSHRRTLILRRVGKESRKLMERVEGILGHTEGRNLSTAEWKTGGRNVEFAGVEHEKDKERYKGIPHDLKFFDEIGDFTESQFRFIKTWNRSAEQGQRSRVLCAGNPPTSAEGLWVIEYWAPWLDPRHPNPAKSGELRWFISDENGKDKEVSGPGTYEITLDDGRVDHVRARSRTFIRARLSDNRYYGEEYAAVLDALPSELRAAYRDGRFDLSLKDNPKQVIPTSWVLAAQKRWRDNPRPPEGVPMCAIGVDPAAGGDDETVLAPRYDSWFASLIREPGKKTPLGSDVAGLVVAKRRDNALPVVDCGGGYGGGVIQTFEQNDIKYFAYIGSKATTARDKSGKLKIKNTRSQAYWQLREALDPDQPGGSSIMLPDDDTKLVADLTAPKFEVRSDGIEITTKDDVKAALGRSPDGGDAVVMAWFQGAKMSNIEGGWGKHRNGLKQRPKTNLGHQERRRQR